MPHCIIEHSHDINGGELLIALHETVQASGLFSADGSDIKVRAASFTQYLAAGQQAPFMHVCLRILSGRTEAQKTSLSHAVAGVLVARGPAGCAVTVEVVDMDRATYAKQKI